MVPTVIPNTLEAEAGNQSSSQPGFSLRSRQAE